MSEKFDGVRGDNTIEITGSYIERGGMELSVIVERVVYGLKVIDNMNFNRRT